jgi:hypothetical protein
MTDESPTEIACHLLPGFLEVAEGESLRARAEVALRETRYVPDAVRETRLLGLDQETVIPRVVEAAQTWLGRPLDPFLVAWTCHRTGDYRLTRDDVRTHSGHYVDATLDFSERSSDEGQVTYTGPGSWLALPQQARSLAIVNRRPDLWRFERYLGCRSANDTIYRLRVLMTDAPRAPILAPSASM